MPKPNSDCRATERKHPWPMVRLGELGTMVRGNGIKRSETIEKGCPCLRYGEIYTSFDVILDKPRSFVPKELFDRSVKIKKGDLVFTLTGENTEEIAKALAYLGDDEIAAGGDLAVWTGHGCDSKYLAYLMYSPQLISQKAATGNGNIVVHTSIKKIQQLEIPLPPFSVQREIVARLERELAAVEKMKKGFEALAETARAEFKAELKEVFEEISRGGAETRRLGEVCELISDCPHTTAKDEGVGIPLIRTPNVGFTRLILAGVHRVSEDVYKQRTKRAIPLPGDLIFAREAPAGNVAVIQSGEKVCLGQRTVLLRLRKGCFSDYIAYSVLQPESQKILIQRSTGSTVAHVNVCDIKTFPIHIPPLSVQREVVARLDAAKARAEKLEAKAREGVAVCETMRKAILKEAFE